MAPGPEAVPTRLERMRRERRKRARRRRTLVMASVALLLVVATLLLYLHYFHPRRGEQPVHVVIQEGDSASRIAEKLHASGVITSATIFRFLSWVQGKQGSFKAGHYLLYPGMRYGEVFALLEEGPNYQVRLTVPEGYTLRQTAERVQEVTGIPVDEFLQVASSGEFEVSLLPPERGHDLEGFLFPKTYDLPGEVTAAQVIEAMLQQFERETARLDWSRAEKLGVTPYQILIIASMIEREAVLDEERPLVAAVIYNRLRLNMPLQIDATVQYALPEWKETLTYEDLKTPSPYNTYLHRGLPPGPICSPGLASIRAALEPAGVDYLYYVAVGEGRHFFTSDYQEFLKAKEEAQEN